MNLTRRIMQLEIEEAALKKEKDALSKESLEALTKRISELKDKVKSNESKMGKRKRSRLQKVQELKRRIEKATT